jgi:hypothetical protein
MAESVYILCLLTSAACAALLLRSWRETRSALLLSSGLCFLGLAINNILLLLDLVVFPDLDLRWVRNVVALGSIGLLIHGLVAESR